MIWQVYLILGGALLFFLTPIFSLIVSLLLKKSEYLIVKTKLSGKEYLGFREAVFELENPIKPDSKKVSDHCFVMKTDMNMLIRRAFVKDKLFSASRPIVFSVDGYIVKLVFHWGIGLCMCLAAYLIHLLSLTMPEHFIFY